MKKAGWVALGLAGLATAVAVAWHLTGDGPGLLAERGGEGPRGRPPLTVETVEAARDTVEVAIESIGTVEPRERVTLTSEVSGRIKSIQFEEGEAVSAGDLLVELYARQERAALTAAQAQYEEARRQHERALELREDGHISEARVDERRAALESADADLEAARVHLADHKILAPFDGRIGLRQVSPGAWVEPATPIATLSMADPVDLQFDVDQSLRPDLRTGMKVEARTEAVPDRTFTGTVRVIEPQTHADTRTVTLEAEIPNPEGLLHPGMFLPVRLILESRENIVIPEEAMILRGTRKFVYTVNGEGTVVRKVVETGERRKGEVEIVSGLEEGEQVVVAGLQKIADGQKVRITRRGADGEGAGTPAGDPPSGS